MYRFFGVGLSSVLIEENWLLLPNIGERVQTATPSNGTLEKACSLFALALEHFRTTYLFLSNKTRQSSQLWPLYIFCYPPFPPPVSHCHSLWFVVIWSRRGVALVVHESRLTLTSWMMPFLLPLSWFIGTFSPPLWIFCFPLARVFCMYTCVFLWVLIAENW